ncbi:hypothetical protein [Frigoriglobus tundricola]|uniref:Uncharacterized protein n=1 Tax=Frigoriglobus tundricola TaxID=2774151 RepID=A0A6M5Z232_9BACT|nr:hypothetical protein [Frigoriglobus tundricola]QJW99630.1 hypothetical protein FTUN_7248 [Frigoriglobus tundricola]
MGIGQLVGALCCAGVSVELLVGAFLVRAAVAVANRVLDPVKEWPADSAAADWHGDDHWEPVAPHSNEDERAIPTPGCGTALVIAFLAAFLEAGAFFGLLLLLDLGNLADVNDRWTRVGIAVFSILFGFAGLTPLLALALPVTIRRAALVAFIHYTVGLFVTASVTGALIAVAAALDL